MEKGFLEITELEDKQKILVSLLNEFHQICEDNGLTYNIFGGTMLGAVRHHGIIPWDDDIDVTMPLHDYKRFIDIVKKSYSKYFMIHIFPDENYIYPYAKFGLIGTELYEGLVKAPYNKLTLNIDLFPNYGYPDDESVFDIYNECERSIILLTYNLPKAINPLKRASTKLKKIVYGFKGINYYLSKQIELLSVKNEETTDYIVCQGAGWGRKGKLEKCKYYDRVLYDFDGIKVWGIRDFHQHLTNLYGDYMTPPQKEKRICPHDSKLWISERIYRQYLEKQ